jgi:hypothetical protein
MQESNVLIFFPKAKIWPKIKKKHQIELYMVQIGSNNI